MAKAKKDAAKKAAPAKKAAAKKAAPAPKKAAEKKGPGKIEQIIALHLKGKSIEQIVAAGFNKTTASIQISKYKKANEKGSKK